MAGRRDPWVRWFDVTSPKKHSGGFTIYKVTSKVFPVHSPEATTEIVVWKRYKDFNKLHKTLSLLHKNLHRPGIFPDFPKPRLFGRFDDEIVEERRTAALELLNFLSSQPHLFNSLAVQQFFETTESTEGEKPNQDEDILQPVTVTPVTPEVVTESVESSEQAGETTQTQTPPTTDNNNRPGDETLLPTSQSVGSGLGEDILSGVWAHRQRNSDSETSSDIDVEPSRNQVLDLESDLTNQLPSPPSAIPSDSIDDQLPELANQLPALPLDQLPESANQGADLQTLANQTEDTEGLLTNTVVESSPELSPRDIMDEFDPYAESSSPRQPTSVTNSELLSQPVTTDSVDRAGQSSGSLPSFDQSQSTLQAPADTLGEYIVSKEDYLYKAVKQIRRARNEEKNNHYQAAFDYYKRAVALLLTGVQGDSDPARRSIVKRKTAEYLVYAEELHNQFLDSSGADGDRWKQQSVPRSVARLRAGLSELANYKVLGLVGSNMLVLDKQSEATYVIKVLQKNCEVTEASWAKQIIPTKCTHMIKLVRYFETESTIYLLLEYASGGTLWQYVHNYLHGSSREVSPRPLIPEGVDNVYSGKKYQTSSSSQIVNPPDELADNKDQQTAADPDSEADQKTDGCSDEYLDMLLGRENTSNQPPAAGQQSTADDLNVDRHTENSQSDEVFSSDPHGSLNNEGGESTGPVEDRSKRRTPDKTPLSLRRSNSSMNRSASVERASDSVAPARQRNWSTAFDDLHVTLPGGGGVTRPHLPESVVVRWAAELLLAVHELHLTGLIIGDLKPDNLLLDSRGHIILTYFCHWPGVHQELTNKSVDSFHVSPECLLPGALCLASDYWSFGVILYELLSGVSLASVHPETITSHTILRTPDYLSQEAQHLLRELLRHNWRERLGGGAAGIDEIKSHPFFSSIDWTTV